MPWGDNGVTIRRQLLDQTAPAVTWAASPVRVPFRGLRTAGYLRNIRLWLTDFTATMTTPTVVTPQAAFLPVMQGINRFQLALQGIALLYDVSGLDIFGLMYMRNGNPAWGSGYATNYNQLNNNQATSTVAQQAPNTANQFVGNTSVQHNLGNGLIINGTTSAIYSAMLELPITEYIVIKDAVLSSGPNHVVVADKMVELGMITLQNTSSNVQPFLQLNPFWGAANSNSPLWLSAGSATGSAAWNISTDIYDVPPSPADRPTPMQTSFVVTRQSFDTPVTGSSATVNLQAAGSIMRMHAILLDANGNVVDQVAAGGTATAKIRWGATTDLISEVYSENVTRCAQRYNQIPPSGFWFWDFVADDQTATAFINTAEIANLRIEFTGINGSVTSIRTMTERLVPVTAV